MTQEVIHTIIRIWLGISITLPFIIIALFFSNHKLRKKINNQILSNRFYEEMLFASKDGYLTDSISANNETQHCSRRLATLLNLKNGENTSYQDIFGLFEQSDGEKLQALYRNLKDNGINFEIIAKTKTNKTFSISGNRINSLDLAINTNCLWFHDITKSTNFIDKITEEAFNCRNELEKYRILIDNINSPICLRDNKLSISILNRPYLQLLGLNDFKKLDLENSIIHDLGNSTDLLTLAKNAQESNTLQQKQINILHNGDLKKYVVTETPYRDQQSKTTYSICTLTDITKFDEDKRNYRVHLDSHLDILSSLDTAFCIINTKHIFTFGNSAFLKLWNLPENFFDTTTHYNNFLDKIRESKELPEVADFNAYKDEENKAFDALTEQREDLLYIPDGRTFRRIRAPHPDGTIIAYEDISDTLDSARKLSDIVSVQQSILDNINDALLIFSPNLKLHYYNPAYLSLWSTTAPELDKQPSLREVLDLQKILLPEIDSWDEFRNNMQKHITANTSFTLKLKNKKKLKVTSSILADTSLMISYRED